MVGERGTREEAKGPHPASRGTFQEDVLGKALPSWVGHMGGWLGDNGDPGPGPAYLPWGWRAGGSQGSRPGGSCQPWGRCWTSCWAQILLPRCRAGAGAGSGASGPVGAPPALGKPKA